MAELKYADVFLTERPRDGIDVVQTRLKKALGLNNELAEYFRERAHLEDQYAKSLLKLTKKVFLNDKAFLGTFTPICDILFQEVEEVAKVHQTMASRITEEVEKPLRAKVMDADWRKLNSYEKTLEAYGRDYDDRHAKFVKQKASRDKASGKKSDSAEKRYNEAKNTLEEVRMSWKLEGPEILEQHQQVDEARLNSLRDAITVFERIHTEQCMKRVEHADGTLAAAATFDVKQEVESFVANRMQTMKTLRKSLSLDDINSNYLRRPSSTTGVSVSSDNSHEVMDSGIPTPLEPEKVPMPSKHEMIRPPLSPSLKPEGSKLGANLLNGLKSIRRITKTEGSFSGFSGHSRDFQDTSYSSSNHDDTFMAEPMSSFEQSFGSDPRPSISLSSESARSQSTNPPIQATNGLKPNIDENGFSIPPPDHPPWETSPVMSDSMSFEDGSENGSMFGPQSKIKVDIKEEPVSTEKIEEVHQAINRVSTMLQSKSTVRTRQGARGRRTEARPSSAYNSFGVSIPDINTNRLTPITDNGSSPVPSPTSSFEVSTPPAALGAINPFEQSISDMQIPTLVLTVSQIKASIVEHVNVLSQGSNIAKILITGDITFVYTGSFEGSPDISSASFQIADFASLEKVTPNTAYIKPVEDQPGVFKINTHMLSLAGGAPITVLKYQVKISDEDKQSRVPLFVQPLWRCDENKTMLMVRYYGNPAFHFDGTSTEVVSTELTELNFLVPVDGGVTNVQSTPSGIWSVEKQKILWHVNDLLVGEGVDPDVPNKLLAKFDTTGKGTPRTVAVKFSCKGRLFSGVRAMALNEDEESPKLEILDGGVEIKSAKYLAEP